MQIMQLPLGNMSYVDHTDHAYIALKCLQEVEIGDVPDLWKETVNHSALHVGRIHIFGVGMPRKALRVVCDYFEGLDRSG